MATEITLSLCLIVRNEEETLGHCLDSIRDLVDEIILVDTGSTDRTKEIGQKYTDKIFDFAWVDDFAQARNFSFSQATQDYILWLDADDILAAPDREKFAVLKKTLDPSTDVVNMPYLLAFDQFGQVSFSLRRNRLVKRSRNFRWVGAVHEYLEVGGRILNSDICVTHKGKPERDSARNLRIFESRLARGEEFSPRDLYYYANELYEQKLFNRAVEFYQKFLATDQGWVEDRIAACGRLADCFQSLNEKDKALQSLFKSFAYDVPRAEACCRLGHQFLQTGNYAQAVFWYKLATQLKVPDGWGPRIEACWTWLPHLQLCVCYDRLGQYELAYAHNEIARTYRPEDPQVLHNKKYLEGVRPDSGKIPPLPPYGPEFGTGEDILTKEQR
ncbi:Glycosyltransferase 2-like [Acididesulfobacillus acetoxydans]|uniref:Glycosyl transferase 2 n=1 Tax=Acididesulfobacillus acetoxydans TaxID=1561005 RepID=A0A8S0WM29_9FIRM|nr:glycosyltransferase [Acididesulfobacillus acetoxydans]CAA7600344.1 Glycosyltransferase 2-like [Acididesulfobacillus acetoxydans]CEJ07866.1 Glycosyl transferase 2 [Acididesulfobacillus acetoxydans]